MKKNQRFYLKIFNFLDVKFSIYLNRRVFVMVTDLLIIDHLISVSLTLPFLPLVFRHHNSLP